MLYIFRSENWFGSWLNAAKNKVTCLFTSDLICNLYILQSTEVLEFVKKDLEEFGSAVKNEASNVVTSTGAVLEKTLKVSVKLLRLFKY